MSTGTASSAATTGDKVYADRGEHGWSAKLPANGYFRHFDKSKEPSYGLQRYLAEEWPVAPVAEKLISNTTIDTECSRIRQELRRWEKNLIELSQSGQTK
jgi:hypothetical protein